MATLNFTTDPAKTINGDQLAAIIDASLEWTGTVVQVGIEPGLVIVTNDVLEETDILRSMVQSLIDAYALDPTFTVVDGVPTVARPLPDVIAAVDALPASDFKLVLNAVVAQALVDHPTLIRDANIPGVAIPIRNNVLGGPSPPITATP